MEAPSQFFGLGNHLVKQVGQLAGLSRFWQELLLKFLLQRFAQKCNSREPLAEAVMQVLTNPNLLLLADP